MPRACADEFLNRMPDGLDTVLEQAQATSPEARSSVSASPEPC